MPTTNRDFIVKNGLVVQGTSATVNGNNVLTSASSIDALSDVIITTPTTNQVLVYNGTNWVNSGETGDITAVTSGTGITVTNSTGPIPTVAVDTTVVATTNNTLTLSNKTISGSSNTISNIGNSSLTNSSITVNSTAISLGGSATITAVNPNALTIGTGLSGTSYNGSAAVTIAIDSTVATTSGTQTLTNKTLTDSTTFLQDETDNTKKLQFQLSGITTNNTRTLTAPDASGTIALTSNNLGAFASTTSAQLAGVISDETGSGSLVFATSPTLVTPNIGVATGTSFNSITGLSSTAPVANGTATTGTSTAVARADHVHPISALTIGTGLSGTSYNGSSAVTIAIDSTVATLTGTQTLTNKTLGSAGSGGATLGANLAAGTYKITGLGTPTASTDAATKQYVDDVAQGLHIHPSVVAATTSALTATYSNGSSGVGATLTNSGTLAAFSIDGVSPAQNDRILVKNQASAIQNGIYTLTTVGSGSVAWVLTRATDMDESVEVDGGDFVFVTGGTVNDNTGWVQTEVNVVIGTNNIIFTQFSGAGTYVAGNGLTLTGNSFSINTSITADLSTSQTFTNKTINLTNNTLVATSAQIAAAVTDETGSGSLVFATSPTLVTPNIGVATGTSFNSITGLSSTAPAANGTATTGTATTVARADHVHPTTGLGLTSGTLAQFASTTSSQLAGVISDETGSGALVFATSPTLVTPNIGVATGTSFNSITGLSSTNPSALGAVAVGTSTTVARADHIHPTTGLALLTGATFTGQVQSTLAWNAADGQGQIYLNGTTGNRIDFSIAGLAAPAFTTRSAGTKIVLYPVVGASSVDYAIGVENNALWQSVGTSSNQFKWYAGTTNIATLTGAGAFSAVTKSFDIEHPTKEGMRLRYGSLEGPENGVYVRGKSEEKTIELPDYWTGLVDEDTITVNLTAIGSGTIFVKEIINNTVKIGGTAKEFFFTVFGERKDVDKLLVEY